MNPFTVTFQPDNQTVSVRPGTTVLQAQIAAGLRPDAPCGGKGTCGKCKVVIGGRDVLACQTVIESDLTVFAGKAEKENILTTGLTAATKAEGLYPYVLAFDIGTTTLVAYLMDGHTGTLVDTASCRNP